jgi:hypothetical protein
MIEVESKILLKKQKTSKNCSNNCTLHSSRKIRIRKKMTELTEIKKELTDLKIRVNNLEKKFSKITKPKSRKCNRTKFI